MKGIFSYSRSLYTGAFILALFIASCDQPKTSDPAIQHSDSLSVKKMDTDSNSEMPVGASKDSAVEIPNAYKPEGKAQ